MDNELWICGQIREKANETRHIWDFQGVFTSEEKAKAACRNDKYFIMPIELDKEYPDEAVKPTRGYYPKAVIY